MARFLDFRSDTLTQPTDAMRKAMAEAEVGDDVFGEDPTVKELEATVAELLDMESALFVPTGTMANQIAIWVHTGRAGQVICEHNCHIALYEGGGAALLSGAHVRTVTGRNGVFGRSDVAPHVYPDDPHFARTRMISIENTHNWAGGRVWNHEQVADIAGVASDIGAALHVDGARIWNAAAALNTSEAELVRGADTVFVALSKGLSAPVGSLIAGTEAFIHEARRVRKVLGGGMRQSGHLAAAGLIGVRDMRSRLKEDHANAKRLAEGLATLDKLHVDLDAVETNMVLADTSATGMNGEDFCTLMGDIDVGCLPIDMGPTARFVTHRHIEASDVDAAVERIRALLE